MTTLDTLVDLKRYPLDDPNGAGSELIRNCRAQLDESAICCLPNFLRPDTLKKMRAEAVSQAAHAHWIERDRSAYSWVDPNDFPNGHAVRIHVPHRYGTITRDRFTEHGDLLRLFKSDALTEILRRCIGFESLPRVECPYLSLNVKVMDANSQLGWHFDTNDGAVSLLLQAPTAGGRYEYVPYIRSAADENYPQVSPCLTGESHAPVLRPDLEAGTLCLFKGNRSLHRVTQVTQGNPDRFIALFSYDEQPGRRFTDRTITTVLGSAPGGT